MFRVQGKQWLNLCEAVSRTERLLGVVSDALLAMLWKPCWDFNKKCVSLSPLESHIRRKIKVGRDAAVRGARHWAQMLMCLWISMVSYWLGAVWEIEAVAWMLCGRAWRPRSWRLTDKCISCSWTASSYLKEDSWLTQRAVRNHGRYLSKGGADQIWALRNISLWLWGQIGGDEVGPGGSRDGEEVLDWSDILESVLNFKSLLSTDDVFVIPSPSNNYALGKSSNNSL